MARHEVLEAVKARFAAHFGPFPIGGKPTTIPVFHPNENTSTKGAPVYVEVQYPVANAVPRYLSRVMLEEGTIRLLVHTERGWGTDVSGPLANALTDLFSFKRFDGVQTFAPSSPVNDDRNDNGAYYTTSITIPYHFYYPRSDDLYT
jgi:hypothetical protein